MSVVTHVDKFNLMIGYFDGKDQLIPYRGFYVEGMAPYVPEDMGPGWVCFEMDTDGTTPGFFRACQDLARKLFCDLGFTADQVIELLEDF